MNGNGPDTSSHDTISPDTNSRRTFIRNSGVALTAALAAGGVSAAPRDAAAERLALLEDSNAIRALQQRCFTLLEQGAAHELALLFSNSAAQATCVYPALQLDSRLDHGDIVVAGDHQSASARFRGRVYLGAPITGDGTVQQMARLQGVHSTQWWEQGEYEARYVKAGGEWKIRALHYRTV
jgi:hypothetical protein